MGTFNGRTFKLSCAKSNFVRSKMFFEDFIFVGSFVSYGEVVSICPVDGSCAVCFVFVAGFGFMAFVLYSSCVMKECG